MSLSFLGGDAFYFIFLRKHKVLENSKNGTTIVLYVIHVLPGVLNCYLIKITENCIKGACGAGHFFEI